MALSTKQYHEIIRGYEERQRENRRILESRREEIYAQIPEFQELDNALGDAISARILRLKSESDTPKESRESGSMRPTLFQEIQERRKALLEKKGYPADYLDPIYDCPDCKDTGYVLSEDGTRLNATVFAIRR